MNVGRSPHINFWIKLNNIFKFILVFAKNNFNHFIKIYKSPVLLQEIIILKKKLAFEVQKKNFIVLLTLFGNP